MKLRIQKKEENILSCLWSNVPTLILSLSVGQINGPWQPEHLVPSMVSCDHSKEAKEEKEVKERWDTYLLQGAPCSVCSWTRCSHPLWLPYLPLSKSEEVVVKMQEAQKNKNTHKRNTLDTTDHKANINERLSEKCHCICSSL